MTRKISYLFLLVVVAVVSCQRPLAPQRIVGEAQGTYYSIIYYDKEQRDFSSEIDSILKAFDQSASLWVEGSLLRRINAGQDSLLDPWCADMLQKSLEMNRYTQGAFDCRVGPIVKAMGFAYQQREKDVNIDSLLTITRAAVWIDTNENGLVVKKENPHTSIDFNAIAQGYCVDQVAAWLRSRGIESYLVDIGGEVIAHGTKPDGASWIVGIERPAQDRLSAPEVELSIRLDDLSVVTSGNYRKYFEKDGVRYSHTIDPTTGRPAGHTLLSASVIDSASWRADALATAFMVMGLDSAIRFIGTHPDNPAAFFIYADGEEYKTYATPAFEAMVVDKQ